MAYVFKDKGEAYELKRIAQKSLGNTGSANVPTGNEVIFVKTPEDGIPARPEPEEGEEEPEQTEAVECTRVYIDEELSLQESEGETLDVINMGTTEVEGDTYIKVVRVGIYWIVLDGSASAQKRVKFMINDTFLRDGDYMSGYANATVIDPMNSELAVSEQIVVWDYKQQFVTTKAGAIGIAVFQAPYLAEEQWHVEECEMLINTIEATIDGSIGPWQGSQEDPDITECKPTSSWPYVIWDTDESYNGNFGKAYNRKRFTASAGKAWLKRVIPDSHLPVPSNTVAPYTLAPIGTAWEFTEVQFPTARWCSSYYDSGSKQWKLGGGLQSGGSPTSANFAEGFNPTLHDNFDTGDPAMPHVGVWEEITSEGLECGIKTGTLGWAFLDDNIGEYVTLMSASALFGAPTKVDMVAKKGASEADMLIKPKTDECGVIEYEHLKNVLVWGNEASAGCPLGQEDPPPEFDVFSYADDAEVITGISVNVNGDLQMTKTTVKACTSPASTEILELSTMDVVNDVYCSGNSLTKNYQQVKFLGSVIGGNNTVSIDTSCVEIDYTQVIYPVFPYIDYYDIIWPNGCDPCPEPTGCCTVFDGPNETGNVIAQQGPLTESECTDLRNNTVGADSWLWSEGYDCPDPAPTGCCTADAYPTGQDGITQADCEAETGYISWTEGSCGGGSCCDTLTVSQIDFGVPSAYWDGSGSIGFTNSNITANGGCSWTVDGTWSSVFDGSTPSGSYSLTYDEGTSTWSINGTIPAPYGGAVTGSAVQDACTAQSGTVLDIPVSGNHLSYSGGTSSYSGLVRISFTQTA